MNQLKICHITQAPGGVESFILNIIKYSDSSLFNHSVICTSNRNLINEVKLLNKQVEIIPMVREISILKDFISFIKISLYINKLKPSIIHGHSAKGGVFAIIIGTILGIRAIYTPHAFSYLSQKGIKRRIALFIEKILRLLPGYFLPSSDSEAKIGKDLGWSQKKTLDIFYNSVPIMNHTPCKQKGNISIITLARLTYQKNPLMFVKVASEILKKNPNVVFKIIGAGTGYSDELFKDVENFIILNKLEDKIIVKEWVSAFELDSELNKADIYLSTSRYEGLPTVILLAYNHSIPIVATNVVGNNDVIVHGKTGLLGESLEDLVAHIELLIGDENLRNKMGVDGLELLKEKFDIKKNIKGLDNTYLNTINISY